MLRVVGAHIHGWYKTCMKVRICFCGFEKSNSGRLLDLYSKHFSTKPSASATLTFLRLYSAFILKWSHSQITFHSFQVFSIYFYYSFYLGGEGCAWVCRCLWRPKALPSHGAGVTGGYELPSVGTLILCKNSMGSSLLSYLSSTF